MKNFRFVFFVGFLLLFATSVDAQITANDNAGMSSTNYTDGSPSDPIYIWCGDNLSSNSGSLTANSVAGIAPYTFTWYYHNEATHSWSFYFSETGASSTISNLPSDGYRVQIVDANGNDVGCYTAWVWNMNAEISAESLVDSCDNTVSLTGTVDTTSSFTYYNPPLTEAIITPDTQITVCFWAVHTYVSDLAFYLVGPGGSPTILLSPNPGANGQGSVCNSNNDVIGLCFTTNSTTNFDPCLPNNDCGGTQTSCTSNYTGLYGSFGPASTPITWSPLYGIDAAQGGWAVQIYDCIGIDTGALTYASISFSNLSTTCNEGSTSISYNSGNINSAINDMSCTPQTASIFEVPNAVSGGAITIEADVVTSWYSNPAVSITDASELEATATVLSDGTYEFTFETVLLYDSTLR